MWITTRCIETNGTQLSAKGKTPYGATIALHQGAFRNVDTPTTSTTSPFAGVNGNTTRRGTHHGGKSDGAGDELGGNEVGKA